MLHAKFEDHQTSGSLTVCLSHCDAVPILKRTGKFQPGPEINATVVQSQNTLTSNELLF